MRRLRLERVFAAIVLLWFACIASAPAAFHSCPVHDTAPPGDVSHGAHTHHLPDDGADRGACTCVGDCSWGGVAPSLPAARTTLPAAVRGQLVASLPRPESPALAAPPFLLPYANGPPGARRVS